MPEPRERGNVVPSRVSKEAWEAALAVDGEVDSMLEDHGIKRRLGYSPVVEAIARMIQLAINKSFDEAEGRRG